MREGVTGHKQANKLNSMVDTPSFADVTVGKNLPANAGDRSLIPGPGRYGASQVALVVKMQETRD